ncbi:MAG: hypothetical protein ACRC4N_16050 [Gammaproteobacteria bacterium]
MTMSFKKDDLVQIKMDSSREYTDEQHEGLFIILDAKPKRRKTYETIDNRGKYKTREILIVQQVYPIKKMLIATEISVVDLEIYRAKDSHLYNETIKRIMMMRLKKGYPSVSPIFKKVVLTKEEEKELMHTTYPDRDIEQVLLEIETAEFSKNEFNHEEIESGQREKVDYSRFETTDECLDAMRDLMLLEKIYNQSHKKEIGIIKRRMARILINEKRNKN